ncbi:unnamed protein product, partial [Bubo scandiacus]
KDILIAPGFSSGPRKTVMSLIRSKKGRTWIKDISCGWGGWREEAERSESDTGNYCAERREKRIMK